MNVLYEVSTIIVAAVIIAVLAIKLYLVGKKADSTLPANASEVQKIETAMEAIIQYLIDNHSTDQELLSEIEQIIQALAALGVNVAGLEVKAKEIERIMASPSKTS